jgi:alkylhydroperoxidase family enzyme
MPETITSLTETNTSLKARMKHPTAVLPSSFQAVRALVESIKEGGVPETTLKLVHIRASQINGRTLTVDYDLPKDTASDVAEKLATVAAWRDSIIFTDAERAALALAESITRLCDQTDPVPDDIWNEAARHYDQKQLAGLVLGISTANLLNRINVSTRQPTGRPSQWSD